MRTVEIAVGSQRVGARLRALLMPLRNGWKVPAVVLERTLKVFRAWSEDRCVSESAAIGFFAAFSMAPMLVVVIAVGGFFSAARPCRVGFFPRSRVCWERKARSQFRPWWPVPGKQASRDGLDSSRWLAS